MIEKCKDTVWFLIPNSKRIQAQRTQYNEFVESGLENQVLMSWTTIIVGPDDKKRKINWVYLKKIILSTIRGDQFLYIFLLNLITSPILVATVFFYQFSDPLQQWNFSSLYCPSLLHLSHPHVDQMANPYPYPISTLLKFLEIAIRLNITVQVSPPH